MARRACIIAVGNEVVHGFIVNTNSAWLARELGELGFDVAYHLSVNDRQDELTARLKAALSEGLFIVTTGGIGPTVDDNTRQSVAAALGVELKLDHDALAKLSERYAAVGRKFPRVASDSASGLRVKIHRQRIRDGELLSGPPR